MRRCRSWRRSRLEVSATLDGRVSSQKPFGLRTFFHGKPDPKRLKNPVKLFGSQKISWVERSAIPTNARMDRQVEGLDDPQYRARARQSRPSSLASRSSPSQELLAPRVTSSSASSTTKLRRSIYADYLRTRFVRFLVSLRKSTQQHTRRLSMRFIPDLPLNERNGQTQMLYKRYGSRSRRSRSSSLRSPSTIASCSMRSLRRDEDE